MTPDKTMEELEKWADAAAVALAISWGNRPHNAGRLPDWIKGFIFPALQSATADLRAEVERQEQRANVNAELWHKAEAQLDELSKSYRVSAEGLQRQLATEREKSAQLERIVVRKKCGCLSMDCTVHGAYICEDLEKFLALTTPPSATEETNL
jgi:hypothetical protein